MAFALTVLRRSGSLIISVLFFFPVPSTAGVCDDEGGRCTDPCPAENSCRRDADCPEDLVCLPGCAPSYCFCNESGGWGCTADCADECGPLPDRHWPPKYVIIDLGTLGGRTSVGLAVNEDGQVAGGADTPQGVRHTVLWDHGTMRDLGTLPGLTQADAWDLNNVGQVVGMSLSSIHGPYHGFLWQDGVMTDLGHLGWQDTHVYAVNDAGQIIGRSAVSIMETHSFLWENGVMTDLNDTLGMGAKDINNLGQIAGGVAGESAPHAAFWDGEVVTDLGTLGGEWSYATSLNDLGHVVGYSERIPGERIFHPFLWDNGVMTDLAAMLGGVAVGEGEAINNRGQIVLRPCFLYDPQLGLADAHDLIPPIGRWYALELSVRDMNDAGQMVGAASFPEGRHAFLMTPIDADFDDDDDVDLADHRAFQTCMTGPGSSYGHECKPRDIDRDGDIDMIDFRVLEWVFEGP